MSWAWLHERPNRLEPSMLNRAGGNSVRRVSVRRMRAFLLEPCLAHLAGYTGRRLAPNRPLA